MKLIVACLVLSLSLAEISARDCVLHYNRDHPGVFLQQFGNESLIVTSDRGKIPITDGSSIQGFCTTAFTVLGQYRYDGQFNNLTFTCTNGRVTYTPPGNYSAINLDSYDMRCQNEAAYYVTPVQYCQNTGLEFGFNVAKTPISLAEVCYNANSSSTTFVHYVVGVRSQNLANAQSLNPTNISAAFNQQTVNFNGSTLYQQRSSLKKAVKTNFPLYSNIVEYGIDSLVDLYEIVGLFKPYTYGFGYSNLVAWWAPLKYGNWAIVTQAIQNLAFVGEYDVYVGSSSAVTYSVTATQNSTQNSTQNNTQTQANLTYLDQSVNKTVPKYIWSYVKERNSQDKGVVVIGVNTPFFDESATNAFLCNDVCHNVDWLDAISTTSHMSALGYVYCCNADDVANSLDGFPQISS